MEDIIREHNNRIRILMIIYYFSEDYTDIDFENRCKILSTNVKIQKIDFLLRNPDYLSYLLLKFIDKKEFNEDDTEEIRNLIRDIFKNDEPEIRRLDMEKFFFGAYEQIDEAIAFLDSIEFIDYEKKRNKISKTYKNVYFLNKIAKEKIENNVDDFIFLKWYINRLTTIQKYFGNLSGAGLKRIQYEIKEYETTPYRQYIPEIIDKVKSEFNERFGEHL